MSSNYLSLEDAAKKLGVTTEQLVAARSEGKLRGFRDGASWKFAESELERYADDMASESDGGYDPYRLVGLDDFEDDSPAAGEGSGVLADELEADPAGSSPSSRIGSDVNLVASDDDGDVRVVSAASEPPPPSDEPAASDAAAEPESDFLLAEDREPLVELDSGELTLSPDEPALSQDSEMLDLAIEPKSGSTGPIPRQDLEPEVPGGPRDSDLSFAAADDQDSGEELLGLDDDLQIEPPRSGASKADAGGLSSLELMDDLDLAPEPSGRGDEHDVLGDLDLLGADSGGSGLISGDSGNVLGGDSGNVFGGDSGDVLGGGSSLISGGSSGRGSGLEFDDDDDELLITDDEDDLVLGGSDLSVSGDSGINLMSPSDSGISLESEPLDLAGSSISALDLGAELGSGIGGSSGKGIGSAGGSHAGEDFQLSPSGIALDADGDSSSQVIEVDDSVAFAEADPLDADAFGEPLEGEDAFAQDAGGFGDEDAMGVEDGFGDEPVAAGAPGTAPAAWEVPYSVFQVIGLVCIVTVLGIGGMLMSDLVRNIWTYSEPAAPVSGLTDWLIDISPFDS